MPRRMTPPAAVVPRTGFPRRHGKLAAWAFGLCLATAAGCLPAQAQSFSGSPGISNAGWKNVTAGMHHFTGLTCPDRMGSLNRLRVLASSPDRIAGCVYQSDTGISAILRSHPTGTSARAARAFEERFAASGFKRLSASGVAANGISFRTGEDRVGTRCETLWRFRARNAEYTLWMSYTLPLQEMAVGPIVEAFAGQLADKSP